MEKFRIQSNPLSKVWFKLQRSPYVQYNAILIEIFWLLNFYELLQWLQL